MDRDYGPHDGVMNYKPSYEYSNPVMTQQPQSQPQAVNNINISLTTHQVATPATRDWNSGLCGCCEDISSCLCLWFCGPCYLCCSLAPRMGEHCCTPVCLSMAQPGSFLTVLLFRTKLRAKYGIRGGAINDCCCSMCCGACVACQIKRELDHLEESLGVPPFSSG